MTNISSARRRLLLAASVAVALAGMAQAGQAEPVKIGIVGTFSGPFAHYGKLFRDSIEAYMASQGGKLGGQEVELIYRDDGGPNPGAARNLAQELVVKDKVQYLAGFVFTPNAMAVAPVATQSKTPMIVFNAGTSEVTEKSEFIVRTSYTLWQVTVPVAEWAAKQGIKKVVTAVTDYAPGIDAETAFKSAFAKQGGTVVETIRMPLATTDFAPFVQRIKATGAQGVYTFLPGGPPNLTFIKAYNENGLQQAGITYMGTAEMDEFDLPKFGDAALGMHTSFHYSAAHDSSANKAFVKALKAKAPDAVANYAAVAAWDGMYVLQKMIEATGGQRDGVKAVNAVRGMKWESPRGPVSIDPKTRHITQNVYMRVVERDKASGQLVNREVANFGPQIDFGLVK